MTSAIDVWATHPQAAHEACGEAWRVCKTLTMAGKLVRIRAGEEALDRTVQQNRYYWGPCLTEISEQARVLGQRYTTEAWHELFKRQFLGYEIKKINVAGRKKTTVIRRLRSTSKLKVKEMGEYLEQVQAFAVDDLGVSFSARATSDYVATRYLPQQKRVAAPPTLTEEVS